MENPFGPSQSHDHAESSSHPEQENVGGGEDVGGEDVRGGKDGGREDVGGGEDVGRENVRGGEDVSSSLGSHSLHEEDPLFTITLGDPLQVLNVVPLETIRPQPEEPIVRKSDRSRHAALKYTPPTIPKRGKKNNID
ncbi:OLC1v1012145C1 [Oldenlandia corymbosa var. corymbosa]|uniref:OLC1v1012145C1 n=1 Tax=Oldenlandia corymbosa var. corymbosa TaxID=529605 RepID=A0AAV1DVE2_OLDCO|nr:OLC1v1012145C1 [Oldenlandia corymbosa var. corymbosa]